MTANFLCQNTLRVSPLSGILYGRIDRRSRFFCANSNALNTLSLTHLGPRLCRESTAKVLIPIDQGEGGRGYPVLTRKHGHFPKRELPPTKFSDKKEKAQNLDGESKKGPFFGSRN